MPSDTRMTGDDRAIWRVIKAKWPYGSEDAEVDAPRGAMGATTETLEKT